MTEYDTLHDKYIVKWQISKKLLYYVTKSMQVSSSIDRCPLLDEAFLKSRENLP